MGKKGEVFLCVFGKLCLLLLLVCEMFGSSGCLYAYAHVYRLNDGNAATAAVLILNDNLFH